MDCSKISSSSSSSSSSQPSQPSSSLQPMRRQMRTRIPSSSRRRRLMSPLTAALTVFLASSSMLTTSLLPSVVTAYAPYEKHRRNGRGSIKGPRRTSTTTTTTTAATAAVSRKSGRRIEERLPRGSSHLAGRRLQNNKNENDKNGGNDNKNQNDKNNNDKNNKGGDNNEDDTEEATAAPSQTPGSWISVQVPTLPPGTAVEVPAPTIVPALEPPTDFLPQTEQPSPAPGDHSLSLGFSLWLGTQEQNTFKVLSTSEVHLEDAMNPIHVSVVQSLWELLCTQGEIEILYDLDAAISVQEATSTDFCATFLANQNDATRRRMMSSSSSIVARQVQGDETLIDSTGSNQDEDGSQDVVSEIDLLEGTTEAVGGRTTSMSSILLQSPSFVNVENRIVDNVTWTQWKTVFYVERIGDAYFEMALSEDASLAQADAATLDHAAVESMRETLQLLLDIAMLDGSLDQVLQERLRINTLTNEGGQGGGSNVDIPNVPLQDTYKVLSSPLGGELETFPVAIPDAEDNTTNTGGQDGAISSPASNETPNTFEYPPMSAQRIAGIVLFIVNICAYFFLLRSSKKRRKRLDEAALEEQEAAARGANCDELSQNLMNTSGRDFVDSVEPTEFVPPFVPGPSSVHSQQSSHGRLLPSLLFGSGSGSSRMLSSQMSDSDLHEDGDRHAQQDDDLQLSIPSLGMIAPSHSMDGSVEISPSPQQHQQPTRQAQQPQRPSSLLALPRLQDDVNSQQQNKSSGSIRGERIVNASVQPKQQQNNENTPNHATIAPTQSAGGDDDKSQTSSFFGIDQYFFS